MDGWNNVRGWWQKEVRRRPPAERNQSTGKKMEPEPSDAPITAASVTPNLLGIKRLNNEIGEWITVSQADISGDPSKSNRYAVIDVVERPSTDIMSLPTFVSRFPWEGFEEIGFRTVKSASP
jgi:hypothetical protein